MVAQKQKRSHKKEDGFDRLARLIKSEGDDIRTEMRRGFAKVAEQFVEVHGELRSIRHEIADINRRLDRLEGDMRSVKRYSKEVDELRARIKTIEKHLHIAR